MELAGSSWVGPVWRPKLSVPPRLGVPVLALADDDGAAPELQAASTGPTASRPAPTVPRRSRSRRVRPGRWRARPGREPEVRVTSGPGRPVIFVSFHGSPAAPGHRLGAEHRLGRLGWRDSVTKFPIKPTG